VVQGYPLAELGDSGERINEVWYEEPMNASQLEILVGTNIGTVSEAQNRYRIKTVLIHDGYSALKKNRQLYTSFESVITKNDIALLELDRPIKFNGYVKALKIAPKNFSPLRNKSFKKY